MTYDHVFFLFFFPLFLGFGIHGHHLFHCPHLSFSLKAQSASYIKLVPFFIVPFHSSLYTLHFHAPTLSHGFSISFQNAPQSYSVPLAPPTPFDDAASVLAQPFLHQ